MRSGENALQVIRNVKKKLKELERGLPPGVVIEAGYNRAELILSAIHTLKSKLVEELTVVALICLIFLLHFRSAFVAVFTLPVGILMAFIAMKILGINANIMSLSGIAIAIGVMVDASVVLVENAHKHLSRDNGKKSHTDHHPGFGQGGGTCALLQPSDHHGFLRAGVQSHGTIRTDVQTAGLHQNICLGRGRRVGHYHCSGTHDLFCPGKDLFARNDPRETNLLLDPCGCRRSPPGDRMWNGRATPSRLVPGGGFRGFVVCPHMSYPATNCRGIEESDEPVLHSDL